MTKVIIVDDEQHVREALAGIIISYTSGFDVIATCGDLHSAREAILKEPPDIVLLDVEMGDEPGLDIGQYFPHGTFKLIFVTAHRDYAVNAFRLNAIDYLLKPVDPDMLAEALYKAKTACEADRMSARLNSLMDNAAWNNKRSKKVVLKTSENIHVLNLEDIMYCQAERSYTKFHLADKNNILVSVTLGEYEETFSDFDFIRIHQSYLLNLDYIKRFDKSDGGSVVLKDGTCLPVATRKRDHLLTLFSRL